MKTGSVITFTIIHENIEAIPRIVGNVSQPRTSKSFSKILRLLASAHVPGSDEAKYM